MARTRDHRRRQKALGELEKRSKREWSALYGRQERQREQPAKDCRGVLGRFRLWRELGGGVREIGGAIRGQTEVLGRFRAELEDRLRWERVSLGKSQSEAVRGIESKAGEFYRESLEGSEKRAREAARSDGLLLRDYGSRPVDWVGVPPVSWTPNPLGEWRTRCQEQDELIHPSFASR